MHWAAYTEQSPTRLEIAKLLIARGAEVDRSVSFALRGRDRDMTIKSTERKSTVRNKCKKQSYNRNHHRKSACDGVERGCCDFAAKDRGLTDLIVTSERHRAPNTLALGNYSWKCANSAVFDA